MPADLFRPLCEECYADGEGCETRISQVRSGLNINGITPRVEFLNTGGSNRLKLNLWIQVSTAHKHVQSMMTVINFLKIGWKQLQILVFFLLTLCAHGAPPGYTLVYTGNFYGPTNVNGSWTSGYFCSLNSAGQGFTQALGYWEVVLNTNNWGYWPDIWLSGSIDKTRTTDSAELGVLDAGPMTAIRQHIKVLSPEGQELLSLLHPTLRGVNQGVHVFGCLIKADFITFSLDNTVMWTAATPPEATQPLFAFCNFVVAKIPPDPGAITTAVINCYVPPTSVTSPSPKP